jgi:thymidylate synthase
MPPHRHLEFKLQQFDNPQPGEKNYFLSYTIYTKNMCPCSSSIHLTDEELENLHICLGGPAHIVKDWDEWERKTNGEIAERYGKFMDEFDAILRGKFEMLDQLERALKEIQNQHEQNRSENKAFSQKKLYKV